jgi:hypothetical protein
MYIVVSIITQFGGGSDVQLRSLINHWNIYVQINYISEEL